MSSTTIASQGGVAVGGIQVGGNVAGDIIVGNYNFKVNTNYGTIFYNAPHEPVIRRHAMKPQPPRAPLDFFDRAGELAQIEQLIKHGKAVAICGSEGAGKSALLRQAANGSTAHTLPDGVLLIEGQDEQDCTLQPGDVVQRLFDAFYFSEPQVKVYPASAQPYLSSLHPLLLLDHLSLEADQLRSLLDLLPTSPALIARPDPLPGLARPIQLGPLPHGDALSLFAMTCMLPLDDATRPALDGICTLLNDVPLAIVRTAEVVRQMNLTLEQTCQRLSAAPLVTDNVITIGVSRALALIQSVLTSLERQVLGVVANLPESSIDVQTIVSISGATPRDIQAAVDHLKALGVLHANSPRVSLDPGLRDALRPTGNEDLVRDRLLTRLLADWRSGRFDDDAYCAAELGQVLGALEWAMNRSRWNEVLALGHAIDRYLTLHGLWDAWGQVADRVLQAARASNNHSAEAWALHQLGTRAVSTDRSQAIDLLKQALHLRRSNGEFTAAAFTQHNLDILIPPIVPPPGSEPSPVAPAGMSAALKTMIAIVAIGVIGTIGAIGYLVLRPAGLRLPQDMIVEAAGPEGRVVTFDATAVDSDGKSLSVTCRPSSDSTFGIGRTTVTCSATNQYGVTTSGSFQLTVQHTVPPLIVVPQPMTLEALSPAGAAAIYVVTASDTMDGPVAAICDPSSGSTFALGSTTVTCTATDTYNNSSQDRFLINVQHTTPPIPQVPKDITVEATSPAGALADYEVSSSDTVDQAKVTCDPRSGSTFALGSTKVICTATDTYNNSGQGSFSINVRHTTSPTLQPPQDMTLEATSPAGAVGTYEVSYSDTIDQAKVICDPQSGSTFALGSTKVICTATDTYNNSSQGSFVITVQHTKPPTITVANPSPLEATDPSGAVGIYTATANDLVDHATVVCAPPPGSVFALDIKTDVTCTATDDHHNTSQSRFQVYVQHTVPPVVYVPKDITQEITSDDYRYQQGTVISYSVKVMDMVDTATVSCVLPPNSIFRPGLTTVHCTATDVHNNVGHGSFQINVRHTPRPLVPSDMVLEATSPSGAVGIYTVSAGDVVDHATVTCDHPSGSIFPLGTTTVKCTAIDTQRSQGTDEFLVTVRDTTLPTVSGQTEQGEFSCYSDLTIQASAFDALGIQSMRVVYSYALTDGTVIQSSLTGNMASVGNGLYQVTLRDADQYLYQTPGAISYEIVAKDNSNLEFTTPKKTIEISCRAA